MVRVAGASLAAAAAAAALLLAGCSGPAAAPGPDRAGDAADAAGAHVLAPLAFPPVGNLSVDGAVGPQDYYVCHFTECTGGLAYDLDEAVPVGALLDVTAELTWSTADDPTSTLGPGIFLSLEYLAGEVSDPFMATAPGHMSVTFRAQRSSDDPLRAVVSRNVPSAGATPFHLQVTSVPVGASPWPAYELEARQAAALVLEGSPLAGWVRVWDGDDALQASLPLEGKRVEVNLTAVKGPVVLQFGPLPADATVGVLQPNGTAAPSLRPLAVAAQHGDARPVAGTGATTWEFTVTRVPLWIGVELASASPGQPHSVFLGNVTITGPQGLVAAGGMTCTLCFTPIRVASAPGAPGLEPGAWGAQVDVASAAGLSAREFLVHYVR